MDVIVTTIAEKIAQPIVDYTVAPVARQLGYLFFYKDNVKNLKDHVAKLKGVKDTINHDVEEERRDGRQIYEAARIWLNKVEEIIEAAEQFCDDPRHKNVGCCKGPFPDFKSRHQLSRKAKKMAENVVEVMLDKDNIGLLTFLPPLESVGFTYTTSSEKLGSRKKMKEDIVLALRDPKLSRVGVYGLGGVGKTTLVKEIARQAKDEKLFGQVVMANISQDVDLERIQGEIADSLGLRFKESTTFGRAARLRQRIKDERSILVILDDIWETLELDKLGIPLNDHKGCKLLLTSRKLDTLQNMETHKDFLIGLLNEEEAWSLFEDMVGDVVKDANLRDVAMEVAKKCGGLIVLIVTVAKVLKNKNDPDSWNNALSQLKTVDEEGMNAKIYSALEFSYNYLKGDDVKELFLLCGSTSPYIYVGYLLKYGMGLGIFKHINTTKDARIKLHKLIRSLKASCLLLESNSNETVEMHDIVQEVAASIASRDRHVFKIRMGDELKEWPLDGFLQRCTQIILYDCHIPKLPKRLECPNVEFFFLSNDNKTLSVPDSFFEGMKKLKVLDLTKMHLPSLPKSFHSLIDLQTLCLDHCVMKDMTNIGALVNLQILSLRGSSIMELPSKLGELTHLKMLDLIDAGIEIFPSNIISKLTKLEELYLGNSSVNWKHEVSDEENKNASLSELRHLTNLTALEIQIKGAWVLPRDMAFDKLERYKIVIGDIWEWSDNYEASKMLKLKLTTVIHLEHGIKELIKGVEDLYLDDIQGISNVLYDLNREGFPLLKHLHIQNNGKIQHIVIGSIEKKQSHVCFPKLETLILQNLNILETICDGSFMNNSFARLRSVKVKCCDQLKYLFSVPMVKILCQLVEIEVLECLSIKSIVFVENSSLNPMVVDENIEFCSLQSLTLGNLPAIDDFYSVLLASSTTTIPQGLLLDNSIPSSFINSKVKLSNLQTLRLSSINLKSIWQDDHVPLADSFQKLAHLSVEDCSSMKYLFSSSVVGSFLNLKQLEVKECEMMEEIISVEGRNDAAIEEVGFPKLETVIICNMKRLRRVWHSQFDGLKTMEVNNCEKLANIFPSVMQGTFGTLEMLKVSNCGLVEEIFQLTTRDIQAEEEATTQVSQLSKLHLLDLPKLKQIWSEDPQGTIHFLHLQDVLVERCQNIGYLFPFSIAVKLTQLEKVELSYCGMSEIVANKVGIMEKVVFHFDRLQALVLLSMPKLDRFYNGNHSLTCPSLIGLWIQGCDKLKLLVRHCASDEQEKNYCGQTQIHMQQPLFMTEKVIPELKEWVLNNKEAIMILHDRHWKDQFLGKLNTLRLYEFEYKAAASFMDSIVQKVPNLKCLFVENSSLKEIFRDKRVSSKEGNNEIKTQLQQLILAKVQLLHICREGCQVDPILEVLEFLRLIQCDSLKILVPSSVTFSHLTDLEIEKCNGLINLIHSSTASSLVKLKSMILKECSSLQEIVTQEMNETRDEIVFLSLRTLELENLSRLNSFSSSKYFFRFPLLQKVVVKQCPRMKFFCETETSSPMLKKVIKDGKDEEWCWEGNLNETISKIFLDKAAFHNSKHLELSMYPELKDSWYNPVENKMFCNLKFLVVKDCDFITNVLISSNLLRTLRNLEEIDVSHCDSLQVVFEFDSIKEEVIHLRKISLSNLPKLQCIWKQDYQEIASFEDSTTFQAKCQHSQPMFSVGKVLFPNLQVVFVEDCENLKYVFSPSLCQELRQLEELNIKSCGVEAIVASEEGFEELDFYFPMLRIFRLVRLRMLNDFYPKTYTLECPSLNVLNVGLCEALKIFSFGHLDSKQALFHIEKVSENLEELSLNEKDAMRILKENYEKKSFQRTEILRLQYFQESPMNFLNELLERFPSAATLQARWSSFDCLFPATKICHFSIEKLTQIKNLRLLQLEQLEHIWSDDGSASHPLVLNLEFLSMWECCRLRRLAPPSTSFTNLTTLVVGHCNGLKYFMSLFTSKSLVHLTMLIVRNCGKLEEIVMTDEGGSEEEIIFKSLEYLELTCLSSFKSFCFGKHTFIFPTLVRLIMKGCQKMQIFSSGIIVAPFLKSVEVENGRKRWKGDLNTTINQLYIEKTNEHLNVGTSGASSFKEQVGQTKPNQTADTEKQESQKHVNDIELQNERPLIQITPNNSSSSSTNQEPMDTTEVSSSKEQVRESKGLTWGTQEKGEKIDMLLVDKAVKVIRDYDAEVYDTIEKPLIQAVQQVQRTSRGEDLEESHESRTSPIEASFSHPKTFETIGTHEIQEVVDKPLIGTDEDVEKLALIQNSAIGTQEIHNTVDKPLIHTDQAPGKMATSQNTEESGDLHFETQTSMSATQNVQSSNMINEAAIDPSPSQAPKPTDSSIQKPNIYRNYKGLIDIPEQSMPYLESGVNRHPQVLNWLNTMRRRMFTSSIFSLFADVTRILRTTQKIDLTEDDRNYIRECCAVLQGVGFDESWISYVHGCIEECQDGKKLKRKIEEAEGQALNLKDRIESMKMELASVEESLVLLRDEASKLHDFIES